MVVDYFTKWDKAMPTFNNTMTTVALFFFNHDFTQFGVSKKLVSDHGRNFEDEIWCEISSLLGFEHQYFFSYYPLGNGQFDDTNKIRKIMLQRIVNKHKTN